MNYELLSKAARFLFNASRVRLTEIGSSEHLKLGVILYDPRGSGVGDDGAFALSANANVTEALGICSYLKGDGSFIVESNPLMAAVAEVIFSQARARLAEAETPEHIKVAVFLYDPRADGESFALRTNMNRIERLGVVARLDTEFRENIKRALQARMTPLPVGGGSSTLSSDTGEGGAGGSSN